MFDELTQEELHSLVVRQMLFLGVLGIGIAAGAHIGIGNLNTACIEAGVLPQPGEKVTQGELYKSTQCWQSALFLQTVANTSAYSGAALLLVGGVVDRHPQEIRDVLATIAGRK